MANWRDMFSGPIRYTPVEPPTNQVYRLKFDATEPYRRRAFPDDETVEKHRKTFEEQTGMEQFQPPRWMSLDPDGEYESTPGVPHGAHPADRLVYELAGKGLYVAPVFALLAALVALESSEGASRIVPGEVYHSHWRLANGTSPGKVLLVNTGNGNAASLIGGNYVAYMLSLATENLERMEFLRQIHKELATVK